MLCTITLPICSSEVHLYLCVCVVQRRYSFSGAYKASIQRRDNIQLYITMVLDISPSMDWSTSCDDFPPHGQPSRLELVLQCMENICK
jgi:hypothetical protein